MRRAAGFILILLSFIALPIAGLAYESNICLGDTCAASEVGQFMVGITRECGNSGNCTLKDIEQVFLNVGTFVLGIIGSIVLLMYVIGGMYMLASRGDSSKVTKGKDYIKISTMGLVIVMFAYIAIKTVELTLKTSTGEGGDYAVCDGTNNGQPCAPQKQCWQSEASGTGNPLCVSKCQVIFPGAECQDLEEDEALLLIPQTYSACHPGVCPGAGLCCEPAP